MERLGAGAEDHRGRHRDAAPDPGGVREGGAGDGPGDGRRPPHVRRGGGGPDRGGAGRGPGGDRAGHPHSRVPVHRSRARPSAIAGGIATGASAVSPRSVREGRPILAIPGGGSADGHHRHGHPVGCGPGASRRNGRADFDIHRALGGGRPGLAIRSGSRRDGRCRAGPIGPRDRGTGSGRAGAPRDPGDRRPGPLRARGRVPPARRGPGGDAAGGIRGAAHPGSAARTDSTPVPVSGLRHHGHHRAEHRGRRGVRLSASPATSPGWPGSASTWCNWCSSRTGCWCSRNGPGATSRSIGPPASSRTYPPQNVKATGKAIRQLGDSAIRQSGDLATRRFGNLGASQLPSCLVAESPHRHALAAVNASVLW